MQNPCSFLPTGFIIFSENSRGGLDFFPELWRCEEQLGLPMGALPVCCPTLPQNRLLASVSASQASGLAESLSVLVVVSELLVLLHSELGRVFYEAILVFPCHLGFPSVSFIPICFAAISQK